MEEDLKYNAIQKINGILIIEDDAINCRYLKQLLKDFHNEILIAKNAAETRTCMAQNPHINLIFLDIQLPDINGLELANELRKSYPDSVIIAQTAHSFIQDDIIRSGCNDYISKPVLKGALYRKIEKYFLLNHSL